MGLVLSAAFADRHQVQQRRGAPGAVLPRAGLFREKGGDAVSSIVLKIPYESQSFHAALTDATLRDRVQEWVAAAEVEVRRGG